MSRKLVFGILFLSIAFQHVSFGQEERRFQIEGFAQGTTYSIIYYAEESHVRKEQIDSVLFELDMSLSLYRPESVISIINHSDSLIFSLDNHIYNVVNKSFDIYNKSEGIFDITISPLVDLWGFGVNKIDRFPTKEQVQEAIQRVGMDRHLKLKKNKLYRSNPDIQINLNGIAQGYSVDVLAEFLLANDLVDFLVELGGEIRANGHKPGGIPFQIEIQRPPQAVDKTKYLIQLENKSITTSGSYVDIFSKGHRVSQHIDPKTGYPTSSSIYSLTVITDRAMDADAWDNVFITMSPDQAIAFANKVKNLDIYMIYKRDNKFVEAYSKGFERYLHTNIN